MISYVYKVDFTDVSCDTSLFLGNRKVSFTIYNNRTALKYYITKYYSSQTPTRRKYSTSILVIKHLSLHGITFLCNSETKVSEFQPCFEYMFVDLTGRILLLWLKTVTYTTMYMIYKIIFL